MLFCVRILRRGIKLVGVLPSQYFLLSLVRQYLDFRMYSFFCLRKCTFEVFFAVVPLDF